MEEGHHNPRNSNLGATMSFGDSLTPDALLFWALLTNSFFITFITVYFSDIYIHIWYSDRCGVRCQEKHLWVRWQLAYYWYFCVEEELPCGCFLLFARFHGFSAKNNTEVDKLYVTHLYQQKRPRHSDKHGACFRAFYFVVSDKSQDTE